MLNEPQGKLLSHEETLALLKRAREDDSEAVDRLVQSNVALVKSIVKRFLNRGHEYDDLFQLGCIGLVKAIKNYDVNYNVRFSTYAVPLIMGEIRRFIRDDGAVKVARPVKELYTKVIAAAQKIKMQMGREATVQEIAEMIASTPEEVALSMEAARLPMSLNAALITDGRKTLTLDDCIGTTDKMEDLADRIMLRQMLEELPVRERQIIFLRYFKDLTQTQIAKEMGISQVQVSRMETKILKKMRAFVVD